MPRKKISEIKGAYFGENLDLSVQAFNPLALAGIAAGVIIGVIGVITGTGAVNVLGNFFASALAVSLLIRTRRTWRYHAAYADSSYGGIELRADGGASSGVAAEKQGC
ncbi:MAG: hypothetical protein LBS35_07395 [Synergistaceae bacterium]|nr:hypothetical protein [Synergistaceae bacterium]